MCSFMTMAVPGEVSVDPKAALTPAARKVCEIACWENEGGGHTYPDGFKVYGVTDSGGICSCHIAGETVDLEVLAYIGELARQVGEVWFLVHMHNGFFTQERFEVEADVEVTPEQITDPDWPFRYDVRYIVRSPMDKL